MPESKEFDFVVILSASTGRLMSNSSNLHGCIEWIMGHPVWTHEFADNGLWEKLQAKVHRQHPDLAQADVSGMDETNCQEFIDRFEKRYGKRRSLLKGSNKRTEHPIDSLKRLAPGKPIIAIET